MTPTYYKHYISVDADGNILDGWSNGLFPDRATDGVICINEQGGFTFQYPTGIVSFRESYSNIPLYKWDGEKIVIRTEDELSAERAAWQKEQQRLAQIAALKAQLATTDYKAIKYAEGWISEDEFAPIKAERQALRDQINALEEGTAESVENDG